MYRALVGEFPRKIVVSILLSAAVLSIANVDMLWQEHLHGSNPDVRREATVRQLRARLTEATKVAAAASPETGRRGTGASKAAFGGLVARLRDTLAQDEIGDTNPYATLSSLDPLTQVLNRGVADYRRQAFRSPRYKDEVGYDLVHYEIQHPDKTISNILAFLDYPLAEGTEPVPTVLILEGQAGDLVRQTLFRAGTLTDQSGTSQAQAQASVNLRLSSGVPFISVSR